MDRSLKIRKQQLTDSTKHPMKQKPKKKNTLNHDKFLLPSFSKENTEGFPIAFVCLSPENNKKSLHCP